MTNKLRRALCEKMGWHDFQFYGRWYPMIQEVVGSTSPIYIATKFIYCSRCGVGDFESLIFENHDDLTDWANEQKARLGAKFNINSLPDPPEKPSITVSANTYYMDAP